MSVEEVERQLLEDYLAAALQTDDPRDLARKIEMYEKQLQSCKDQSFNFNWPWLESMVYYLKARQKLLGQGFMEKTLRSTAQQSTGFDGIAPALLAKGREASRGREAVSLLSEAIRLYEDPDYRFLRANLNHTLKDREAALEDVEYLLSHYSDDKEVYLAARKLKDEIETSQKEGCFIATAVYTPSETAKIDLLRSYRDEVLLKTTAGRAFVWFYYIISPNIARVISQSRVLKATIRSLMLEPIVCAVRDRQDKRT